MPRSGLAAKLALVGLKNTPVDDPDPTPEFIRRVWREDFGFSGLIDWDQVEHYASGDPLNSNTALRQKARFILASKLLGLRRKNPGQERLEHAYVEVFIE